MGISGVFYDGKSSMERPAELLFLTEVGLLRVEGEKGLLFAEALLHVVVISPPLGQTARTFRFPCGGVFETRDHEAVHALQTHQGRGVFWHFLHTLESRWFLALVTFFLVLAALVLVFYHGAPILAREVAFRLPASILDHAGESTLKSLDQMFFAPSGLSPEAQEDFHRTFAALWEAHPEMRLLFRKGGRIGANALALPGNIIVVTDELLALGEGNPDGLEGVLAHEAGHGRYRHAARRVIQDSLLTVVIMGVTGDGSGIAELFMGLPVLMSELAYSRAFEREADAYAMAWLDARGKSSEGFARLLINLHEKEGLIKNSSSWQQYLSTHPLLEERLEALR